MTRKGLYEFGKMNVKGSHSLKLRLTKLGDRIEKSSGDGQSASGTRSRASETISGSDSDSSSIDEKEK